MTRFSVPVTKDNTTHPSGATGVAGVLLEVSEETLHKQLTNATAAILDKDLSSCGLFQLSVPHEVDGAKRPSIRIERTAAKDEKEDVSLSLALQTSQHLPDIHHKIDDGTISIKFERP